MTYQLLSIIHIAGAILVLGCGIAAALCMAAAHRSKDAAIALRVNSAAILAVRLVAGTAVLVLPVSGFMLSRQTGVYFTDLWLFLSIVLFFLAAALWLPVMWMQIRMRSLAAQAAETGRHLPELYHHLFRRWFFFAIPAFVAVSTIIWLMIAKPTL